MQTERRPLAVWIGLIGMLALAWATPARAALGGGIFIPGGGSSFNPAVSNSYNGTFTGNGGGLTNLPSGTGLPGTNTLIGYGDARRTNAVYIGAVGEILSNALGSVTISGGVITSTNATGGSNVISGAGWTAMSGALSNNSVRVLDGNMRVVNSVLRIAAPSGMEVYSSAAGMEGVSVSLRKLLLVQSQLAAANDFKITWGPNAGTGAADGASAQDAGLSRDSAGWLQLNNGLGQNLGGSIKGASAIFTNTVTGTNGFYGRSNVVFHVPTNAPTDGQVVTASGTTGITRWADATGGGTGIATNGGSGINNVFTNATLNDASGINTFRPSTREVVNSSGNVVADFDARNLNGTGGNALNWSADGTLVRVFNDLQIDGHLTTPAALVTNTPATDEVLVYSSPTTAKSTASLTLTSLNVGTAGGNGRSLTNLNGGSLFWNTNGVTDITLIDLTKTYAHTNHTANFTISGFTTGSYPAGGTNYPIISRWYTNNSVGAKTITLPASWLDLGIKGNPVYNTNYGVLSLWIIPGSATNYLWVGR